MSRAERTEGGPVNHQVFICHASEDKPIADAVCAFLEESRVPCWIAPRDILPAEDYGQAIVESISSSRVVVFVFSANANASPHVRRELECAVSHGIPILPFRIEDAVPSESLQYYLGGIHWLDALTPPLETHLQHLAGTVRVLLDRDRQVPSGHRPPPGPPPSPGVAATRPAAGRKGSSRTSLIALGVLAVVGIAIGFAVALSGGRGGGTNNGTTTSASSDIAVNSGMDIAHASCALLDAADVRAVYGSQANPGTPNGNDGWCDFGLSQGVKIYQEAAIRADYDSSRESAAAAIVDVDLSGLDGAAYQYSGGDLTVFDAKRRVIFDMITGSSGPADAQRLVDLVKLMLARP